MNGFVVVVLLHGSAAPPSPSQISIFLKDEYKKKSVCGYQ
jgi:hypothetical protein